MKVLKITVKKLRTESIQLHRLNPENVQDYLHVTVHILFLNFIINYIQIYRRNFYYI